MAPRQGLNMTLSYFKGGARHTYQVRANMLTHGVNIVFEESRSRVRKAFYPHRLSSAQFMVVIDLVGEDEYTSFSSWLATYAQYILALDLPLGEFPAIAVSLPSENFLRKGVPLSGFEWGDKVGAMSWQVQIVFETSEEYTSLLNGTAAQSRVSLGLTQMDRDIRYFYPSSTQLNGSEAPPDGTYTKVFSASEIIGAVAGNPPSQSDIALAQQRAQQKIATMDRLGG